jgi:hypothetical protein
MIYAATITKQKTLTLSLVLFVLAFCIPLLFNGSQIVTGVIVNTLLFIAAARVSKRVLPLLAMIPSLGALSHGFLFGTLTMYLVYFLPFIWIGNMLLMYVARSHKKHAFSFANAAISKSIFLYGTAFVFVALHLVPKLFLSAMGIMQFVTAIVGGIFALGLSKYLFSSAHE